MPGLAVITEACIDVKDRACVDVCPVQCIYEFDPHNNVLFSEVEAGNGITETTHAPNADGSPSSAKYNAQDPNKGHDHSFFIQHSRDVFADRSKQKGAAMLTDRSSVTAWRRGSAEYAGCDADGHVVTLRGEHDISTVNELSEAIARAIALDDGDLVIDLSGVDFMGAATIRVLVHASEALRLRTRSSTLRSPSTRAQRVLDACGLDSQLGMTSAGRHPAAGTVVMFPDLGVTPG